MFSQNTAQLSNGVHLFYSDSGPVPGSPDYTTVIFIHGTGFNGYGFENLHDLAASRNLRTIAINRRDHPGSTPYTDKELDDIKNGRQSFIDAYSLLVIDFICYVAEHLRVPPASIVHASAGIALVGWSHGGAIALWALSNPKAVSSSQRSTLEKYLRKIIIYDSAPQSLGFPVPQAEPVGDEPKSHQEYLQRLPVILTSYYDHPTDWNGDINLLDRHNGTNKATWNAWTKEQKARYITWESLDRSELRMYAEPMLTTKAQATQRALFDEDITQHFCPDVTFGFISSGKSLWMCRYGPYQLQETYHKLTAQGVTLRPLKTAYLADCNHFAHYDYPNEFLDAVQNLVGPTSGQ